MRTFLKMMGGGILVGGGFLLVTDIIMLTDWPTVIKVDLIMIYVASIFGVLSSLME